MQRLPSLPAPAGYPGARGKGSRSATYRSLARDWHRWSAAERIAGVALALVFIAGTVVGGAGRSLY